MFCAEYNKVFNVSFSFDHFTEAYTAFSYLNCILHINLTIYCNYLSHIFSKMYLHKFISFKNNTQNIWTYIERFPKQLAEKCHKICHKVIREKRIRKTGLYTTQRHAGWWLWWCQKWDGYHQ